MIHIFCVQTKTGLYSLPMATLLFMEVLFGSIGTGAFIYGKKKASAAHMLIGAMLVFYPYVVSGTAAILCIGIMLTLLLFVFKA